MPSLIVRPAKDSDIDAIKAIADENRDAIGFTPRPKITEAISESRVKVVGVKDEIAGFVIYRHRKTDSQTTLLDICVIESWRYQGAGRRLIKSLHDECRSLERHFILLKCPEDLPANAFYRKLGFQHIRTENGRARKLSVWRLDIISNGVK